MTIPEDNDEQQTAAAKRQAEVKEEPTTAAKRSKLQTDVKHESATAAKWETEVKHDYTTAAKQETEVKQEQRQPMQGYGTSSSSSSFNNNLNELSFGDRVPGDLNRLWKSQRWFPNPHSQREVQLRLEKDRKNARETKRKSRQGLYK